MVKDLEFDQRGIVVDGSRPTTIKTRVIAQGQHVVRIDNESKADCPITRFRISWTPSGKIFTRLMRSSSRTTTRGSSPLS